MFRNISLKKLFYLKRIAYFLEVISYMISDTIEFIIC